MRVKGLVVWPLVGGVWAGAEERVFAGEKTRGGGLAGEQCPGRTQRTTACVGGSGNGNYYAGRIDPVINYSEDDGNQVSHCLIFVTGVTNMKREKN